MRHNMRARCSPRTSVAAALFISVVILLAYIRYARYAKKEIRPPTGNECEDFSRLPHCHHRWIHHGHFRLPRICSSESCRSDYARHLNEAKDAHPIPTIRHILWKNDTVPERFVEHLRSWQRIHPNWTYILWREEDMQPFAQAYYPVFVPKFRCLPDTLMRVHMMRYMVLHRFGGVYADLDYTLVRSLDQFRSNYAVLTQEPEAHSLQFLGMKWPPELLLNPAFMMSAPNHTFLNFVIKYLRVKPADKGALNFAGSMGLTEIMENYRKQCPIGEDVKSMVIVPPSYSFYSYRNNRLFSSQGSHIPRRLGTLRDRCAKMMSSTNAEERPHQLRQFCTDVTNMDQITDKSKPVFATPDEEKSGATFDSVGSREFTEKTVDIRLVLKNLKLGRELF